MARRIKIPTLVLNGDRDFTTPLSGAKKFFKSLAGEKMMVITRGADHFHREKKHFNDLVNATYNFILYNLPRK